MIACQTSQIRNAAHAGTENQFQPNFQRNMFRNSMKDNRPYGKQTAQQAMIPEMKPLAPTHGIADRGSSRE